MKNGFDVKQVATKLWREYGYVFGIRDEELPYVGSDGILDFKHFSNAR